MRTTSTTTGHPAARSISGSSTTSPPFRRRSVRDLPFRSTRRRDRASDAFLHGPDSLEGLLSRYGVDIAFNGHAHIYERNNANGAGGLISYVTGGGGAPLQPVSECSVLAGIVAYAIGWSNSSATGSACGSASRPVSPSQVFHFLLVRVDGNTVTVTPTDSLGRTFDSQTYVFPSAKKKKCKKKKHKRSAESAKKKKCKKKKR